MIFRELLSDWEDPDVAEYYLACCLGLIDFDDSFALFRESKHIFWTGNEIENMLNGMLEKMTENQMLEFNEAKGQYRWNKSFNMFQK